MLAKNIHHIVCTTTQLSLHQLETILAKEGYAVITCSPEQHTAHAILRQHPHYYKMEDFLTATDADTIRKKTRTFTAHWADSFTKYCVYEGIVFPLIDTHTVYRKGLRIMTCLISIQRILEAFPKAMLSIRGKKNTTYQLIYALYMHKIPLHIPWERCYYPLYHAARRLRMHWRAWRGKIPPLTKKKHTLFNVNPSTFCPFIAHMDKHYQDTTVLLTTSQKRYAFHKKNHGCNAVLMDHFPLKTPAKNHRKYISTARKKSQRFMRDPAMDACFFHNQQVKYVVWRLLSQHIQKYYPRYVDLITTVTDAYQRMSLEAIFVWTDALWVEKICVLVAKKKGIYSVVIQHGIFAEDISIPYRLHADLLAVFGETCRKKYRALGLPAHKLKTVGSLQADSLYHAKKHYDLAALKKQFQIPAQAKTIVFPVLPLPAFRYAIHQSNEAHSLFSHVMNTLATYNNIYCFVKCRNATDYRVYTQWGENWNIPHIRYLYRVNLPELLYVSDLIITYYSTIVLEGALLGKPVCIANFAKENAPVPYVKDGLAIEASTEKQLKNILSHILGQETTVHTVTTEALQKYIRYNDGNTSARIMALLKNMDDTTVT